MEVVLLILLLVGLYFLLKYIFPAAKEQSVANDLDKLKEAINWDRKVITHYPYQNVYKHPPMYGPPYGNQNLSTKKSPPPPPPKPVYKEPVSRGGYAGGRDPRELGNSDIADDLLLNPISPVSIWHSSDDSHSSSWSNDSGSSYDSGSSDSGGGDCGGD